jgi:phosphate transport system permease protein
MAKNLTKYRARRVTNAAVMGLCWGASGIGIAILFIILGTLIYKGVGSLSLGVFTEDMPPPGADGGGLRNAIVGSLMLTFLGTLIGTPIGILAGTYMAEYGRHTRLATAVRFINDILLSAPSIVIGLFVYGAMVRPMGHFSGLAGAIALAVLVIPIVVRTTENMLLLVPNQLREAASAMGLPRALVIRYVAYKAAMAGMITGVLLAIARISGETAPLLFTVLDNQFFTLNLNREISTLPAIIYKFASSAYGRWIDLAWTGALLITVAVLTLSILARWLSFSRGKS